METLKPYKTERDNSVIMRKVRSNNTTPEVIFRKALWAKGLRYKICQSNLPGKPDIVIPSKRLAIFIDGDFWHGIQWRKRNLSALEEQFRETGSKEYWQNKIRRNMSRDCAATASLLSDGWIVLRFWESEVQKNLGNCVDLVLEVARKGAMPDLLSVTPKKTFAEFFAGIGLMRMGLERQGWNISFANDIDVQKYEMYKEQFNDADRHFLLGDIHIIPVESVPTVTLATASFPCNDLSLAGARKGLSGKQSSAFWGFVRILEEMKERKPPIILLENVVGFLTSHKGADFKEALLALNRLGYDVDTFILDAARFVPQSRQRLFVVGILGGSEIWEVRETLRFYESDVRPKAIADFIFTHPEIRWNIRDLPSQPQNSVTLESILEDIPETAPEWWSPERAEYLLNQMSNRHREIAMEMITGDKYSHGTVFRRVRNSQSMAELRTDGFAGCLRTPRGGSGRQILFMAGKGRFFARLLTPRECARLMGADDYQISVPLNQALFGFGDAVCVPVIEWIAKYYLNPVVNELIRGRPLCLYVKEG
ncbi:MAG: DNA mismatch endonuclease Vsr [Firmicutes bacterium]|nr:DNA mismatch endonuclease Vsr [Bacillota bacterium]